LQRILGIDYGDVRVGLAISDLTQTIAQPFKTLLYSDSNNLLNQLDNIIKENDIGLIVVGIPYNMKGEDTQQTTKVREFISLMQDNLMIEIKLIDERLTSLEAEKIMHKMNIKTGSNKTKIDKIAASIILQEYLQTIS
tara:strand:+ start:257 stop:670 length:414 start_codon:yes stop_codon:yes gene_type:complete